ncbi:MAG: serine/threonine-protein kinase [Nannocystaceae bacterium]
MLHGRFHIREVLGEGGMGHVYRAYDEAAGREVALKLLIVRYLGRPERELRMLREAELGRRTNHPHLVTYLDAGRFGEHGWPFIVSELVKGHDLGLQLAAGPLPERLAARIARQLAGALRALHSAGVVHRDVTADNVLMDGDHATLIDLSHAGDLSLPRVPAGQPGRLTRLNEVPGTHLYMSREQANAAPADPTMDVFAFGVTLIHMLTGIAPRGYGREEYIAMQRQGLVSSPRIDPRIYSNVPPALLELANACVHEEAEHRPTMDEIVDRLDRLLAAMVMPVEPTRQIEAANDEGVAMRDPDAPRMLRRPKPQRAPARSVIDADACSKPLTEAPAPAAVDEPAPDMTSTQPRAKPQRRIVALLVALLVGALVVAVLVLSIMLARERGAADEVAASAAVPSEAGSAEIPPHGSEGPMLAPLATVEGTTSGSDSSDGAQPEDTEPSEPPSEPFEPEEAAPEPPVQRPSKPATPACDEVLAKVDRAVAERDWRKVLRLTRSGRCWDHRVTRIELRVQAFAQLQRWQECTELATTVDSVEMKRAASRCAAALKASNQ